MPRHLPAGAASSVAGLGDSHDADVWSVVWAMLSHAHFSHRHHWQSRQVHPPIGLVGALELARELLVGLGHGAGFGILVRCLCHRRFFPRSCSARLHHSTIAFSMTSVRSGGKSICFRIRSTLSINDGGSLMPIGMRFSIGDADTMRVYTRIFTTM